MHVTTFWSHPVFLKRALGLVLVGDVFGLLAAFLGLNGVYLIHVIDIPPHTHTLTYTLVQSLRLPSGPSEQEADWWLTLQTDSRQSFAL